MFDYHQLRALAAVIREGSFEAAAAALHVTPSAVSQRIRQLEELLGGLAVVRGRPCVPTPRGRALYRHALQVQLLEADLQRELGEAGGDAGALIHLAVNADSLATWLMPALAEFTSKTGLSVKVELDDQDRTAEWLRSGRVLAAVTSEARPVQGCAVEPLGILRYRATASPDYVRQWFAEGLTAETIRRAPTLLYDRNDQLEHRYVRRVLGLRTAPQRAHWLPSSKAFVEACLLGMGWAINPEPLVADHLRSGALVDLVRGKRLDVPLYWQHWRLDSRTLAQLSRAVASAARKVLKS
ncbi:MAG: LysR family transcriptional regulator ArgP [Verrucomicrobia bacterium]|nr:LysR family transcriptional regulator ArgP [Verrucomicrobiota bacterium]